MKSKIKRDIEYTPLSHTQGTLFYSDVTYNGDVFGLYGHNAIKKIVNDEIIYIFKNIELMHKGKIIASLDEVKGNLNEVSSYFENFVKNAASKLVGNEFVDTRFRDILEDVIETHSEALISTGLSKVTKTKIEAHPANEGRTRVIITEYHINGNIAHTNDSFEDRDLVYLLNATAGFVEDVNNGVVKQALMQKYYK